MPIVVIFITVAGAIAIAILYPHLRWVALAVLAVFVTLFAGYFLLEPQKSAQAMITAEEVQLDNLELAPGPRFTTLSGSVENTSAAYHLRSVDLQLTLRDCPDASASETSCAVIAQSSALTRVDVPAGQTRRFTALFTFTNMPALKGVLVWRHEILATGATD